MGRHVEWRSEDRDRVSTDGATPVHQFRGKPTWRFEESHSSSPNDCPTVHGTSGCGSGQRMRGRRQPHCTATRSTSSYDGVRGPATDTMTALGATVQLSAEVRDQNATVIAGATVTWTSSAISVATVDMSGLVTAAGNGTATITESAGSASGSAVVTVTQSMESVVVPPSEETIALGNTLQLTAEAFDESGHAVAEVEFSWESSDAVVATVDASGLVTGVAVGLATITASVGSGQGASRDHRHGPGAGGAGCAVRSDGWAELGYHRQLVDRRAARGLVRGGHGCFRAGHHSRPW